MDDLSLSKGELTVLEYQSADGAFIDFASTEAEKASGRRQREWSSHGHTLGHARKSMRKSRKGCLTCKRRKIKCDENRPVCEHCHRRRDSCVYPDMFKKAVATTKLLAHSSSCAPPRPSLATHPALNMADLAAFHHFLFSAYPFLPVNQDEIWTYDVPQLAQGYNYLMHALLALGSSHLGKDLQDTKYERLALVHRGKAISGLTHALAQTSHGSQDWTAMLATSCTLMFHSKYLGNGVHEYLSFFRGCTMIRKEVDKIKLRTHFKVRGNCHITAFEQRACNMPPVPVFFSRGAIASLLRLKGHVPESGPEHEVYAALLRVFEHLRRNSKQSYLHWLQAHQIWTNLSTEDFEHMFQPANSTAQVLVAHFIALQLLTTSLSYGNCMLYRQKHDPTYFITGVAEWAQQLFVRAVGDQSLKLLMAWQKLVVESTLEEVQQLADLAEWDRRPRVLPLRGADKIGDGVS